ncbi:MAG TPA: LamG-like jellyroll fold domain-containing protein [Bryobacteraceae bacterium]|nr:LamG-like jellyroll fold domain-containing protein [Bryobacteraceae bacterium]
MGHPRVIDTPAGKAAEFNGAGDALFVDTHPLAGATTFTWEVIFRPDHDGKPEQRFFHLQERDAKGADTENRMLFEIRIIGGRWCLDSFVKSSADSHALMNRQSLHPLDAWYHAAMVYDGREFRNYVNGKLDGSAQVKLTPQGQGRSSAGVRINLRDYFKGAIRLSRTTRRALAPSEFLKLPAQK